MKHLLTIFFMAGLVLVSAMAAQAAKPIVYIVHSYEENHVCGQPQDDGVVEALRDSGLYPDQVDVRSYYMDTKRTNTTPEAMQEQGALALEEIETLKPLVVVTLDDNAFSQVGLKLVGRPDVSVVFSGMNGQPEEYNKRQRFMESRQHPGHNVTGVYEKLHLKRAVAVLAKTLGKLDKVVGITDHSPTGNGLTRQFELEAAEGLGAEWSVQRVDTFDEYKDLIRAINADDTVQAIYPAALTLDDHGQRVTAPEIFTWTIRNSIKPEIPLNYYFCSMGLFGGASVDFGYMGHIAGAQVSSIIEGTPAGDLPIVDASNYAIVFNTARAEMLGIKIPEELLLASDTVFKRMLLLE